MTDIKTVLDTLKKIDPEKITDTELNSIMHGVSSLRVDRICNRIQNVRNELKNLDFRQFSQTNRDFLLDDLRKLSQEIQATVMAEDE